MKSHVIRLIVLGVLLVVVLAFKSVKVQTDCDDAKSYGDDAYTYFKKGYNASNLTDAQYFAKKGMSAAEDAESAATDEECDCEDAESAASDAYSFGKKAYYSTNLSDAQYYLKKAMSESEDITTYAEDCEE